MGDNHEGLGVARRIRGGFGKPLDTAYEIVAQVSDRPAEETRQTGDRRARQRAQPVREMRDRIMRFTGRLPSRWGRPAVDAGAAIAPRLSRLGAEERITRPALSTHERFEEKRERRLGDLCERGDGCVRVRDDFADHGNNATAGRLRALEECVSRVHYLDFAPMRWSIAFVLLLVPARAPAQDWNGDSALALARRAIERRAVSAIDTALRDYKAQAHGFLFFLGQFGEGLTEPPRLVKADQLELEVYWKSPGLSKQRIVGWRDRAELPTDINYHRDHLGIIQNNFGRAIRLGEGDEVRDVPHPLAPGSTDIYNYALGDTTTIVLPQRAVRVVALRVRPKNFDVPAIVGTLFIDLESAELVRMAFNFTPRAYLDPQLEDVSIVLDNALWEGRFWLPYRQEVEIRRRATWLDIPARGIIRGRWEIDGYVFNLGLETSFFRGEEITALPKAQRDSFPWRAPLSAAIQNVAEPVRENDLQRVRAEVSRIAGRRALTGLKRQRLGARALSELVHVDRVEGLAVGAGFVWRTPNDGFELRGLGSYGFADRAGKGSVALTSADGFELAAYRQVRDIADVPVIAPLVNSIGAQEFGDDFGDYYRATGVRFGARAGIGTRGESRFSISRERVASLAVRASPATGRFRPNPLMRDGDYSTAALTIRRRSEGFAVRRDVAGEAALEVGERYTRMRGVAHWLG